MRLHRNVVLWNRDWTIEAMVEFGKSKEYENYTLKIGVFFFFLKDSNLKSFNKDFHLLS